MIFDGGRFKSNLMNRTLRLAQPRARRYNRNEANRNPRWLHA
jgi:hypothetical protein